MKVKREKQRLSNDVFCVLECEHCHAETDYTCYDDRYFWTRVLPAMKCPMCGKSSNDAARAALKGE